MSIERLQEALQAAQLCLDSGLYASATSRAYYAMFWAAQAALAHVGIRRSEWSHPALQASFVGELIRRWKHYPALLGQHLNRTLQLRLDADYRLTGVSQQQATRAVHWTQSFVAMIQEEVSHGTDHPERR
jgi:uncharacterized protein (UPF0332 family)